MYQEMIHADCIQEPTYLLGHENLVEICTLLGNTEEGVKVTHFTGLDF